MAFAVDYFHTATINNYARMGVIFIVIDNADSNPGARVRTAAKRRTGVRRLCVRTILQGDEAQRNNPFVSARNSKMPQRGILVTRDSLLVTRVSPFAEASGDKPHPPTCKARHPPPPQQGRWAFNHPAPTTHENCIFAGPGIGHPSAR